MVFPCLIKAPFELITIDKLSHEKSQKILSVWKKAYSYFSEDYSMGEHVSDLCLTNLEEGIKLAFQDDKGLIQGLARLTISYSVLKLEELVVAPWNCSTLQEHLPFQKESIKKDPQIVAYVEENSLDLETFVQAHKNVGKSLIEGACQLGQTLCLEKLQVSSLPETALFYHKAGLSPFDFHPLAFFKNLR